MVGGAGFELATLCSQDRCATTALTPDGDADKLIATNTKSVQAFMRTFLSSGLLYTKDFHVTRDCRIIVKNHLSV
jgi:hypothetical protein